MDEFRADVAAAVEERIRSLALDFNPADLPPYVDDEVVEARLVIEAASQIGTPDEVLERLRTLPRADTLPDAYIRSQIKRVSGTVAERVKALEAAAYLVDDELEDRILFPESFNDIRYDRQVSNDELRAYIAKAKELVRRLRAEAEGVAA